MLYLLTQHKMDELTSKIESKDDITLDYLIDCRYNKNIMMIIIRNILEKYSVKFEDYDIEKFLFSDINFESKQNMKKINVETKIDFCYGIFKTKKITNIYYKHIEKILDFIVEKKYALWYFYGNISLVRAPLNIYEVTSFAIRKENFKLIYEKNIITYFFCELT